MADRNDWVVQQMARLAERERKRIGKRKPKKISPQEQMQRFLSGAEFERVQSGEITPTQFQAYRERMLKKWKVGVE